VRDAKNGKIAKSVSSRSSAVAYFVTKLCMFGDFDIWPLDFKTVTDGPGECLMPRKAGHRLARRPFEFSPNRYMPANTLPFRGFITKKPKNVRIKFDFRTSAIWLKYSSIKT